MSRTARSASLAFSVVLACITMTTAAFAEAPDFQPLTPCRVAPMPRLGPPRSLPARTVLVPQDVDATAQALIAAPYRVPSWNAIPATAEEWRALVKKLADAALPALAKAREMLGVTMEPTVIGGLGEVPQSGSRCGVRELAPCGRFSPPQISAAVAGDDA